MLNNKSINIFFKNKNTPFNFIFNDTIENIHNIFNDIIIKNDIEYFYNIKTKNINFYFNLEDIICIYVIDNDELEEYKYELVLYNKSLYNEIIIPFMNKIDLKYLEYLPNNKFIKIFDKNTLVFAKEISGFVIKNRKITKKREIKKVIKKDKINNIINNDFEFKIIEEKEKNNE